MLRQEAGVDAGRSDVIDAAALHRERPADQIPEVVPDRGPGRVAVEDVVTKFPALFAEAVAFDLSFEPIALDVDAGRYHQHLLRDETVVALWIRTRA